MSGTQGGPPPAVLYTRAGCHLCYVMHRAARRCARRHGVALRVVDVDASPEFAARYGQDVPVLELPHGQSFRGRAASDALDQAFLEARRGMA
jgi:glutaredoxin